MSVFSHVWFCFPFDQALMLRPFCPSPFSVRLRRSLIGSLSTRVFGTRTVTGREPFVCHDSDVSQIFILIISNGEKILSNVNMVV